MTSLPAERIDQVNAPGLFTSTEGSFEAVLNKYNSGITDGNTSADDCVPSNGGRCILTFSLSDILLNEAWGVANEIYIAAYCPGHSASRRKRPR